MELQTVGIASIIGMIFSGILAVGAPIALLIVGKIKFKAKISSFFIGCGVFLVFALILEQILHAIVLKATGSVLTDHIVLYALYGGLAAAVFEEVGRFLAMKFFLKKNQTLKNAFMYGFGHGGFEAIAILGLTEVNNIATSVMINLGLLPATLQLLDEETQAATYRSLSALWTTPAYEFYLGGIERIFAIILQVGFSIIMYTGVKYCKKQFVALAFVLHFAVDFVTAAMSKAVPSVVIEILIAVCAVVVFLLSHRIVKSCETAPSEQSMTES